LAALIQRPSGLDPAVNPEGSATRWNWVLDGMVTTGKLSASDRAAQVFPPTVPADQYRAESQTTGRTALSSVRSPASCSTFSISTSGR
jgi:membrane peptidoglycan carboxypeptidase